MSEELTMEDLLFIQESLKYTKDKFENYEKYPSYEYKQKRVDEAATVLGKVAGIIKKRKENA